MTQKFDSFGVIAVLTLTGVPEYLQKFLFVVLYTFS